VLGNVAVFGALAQPHGDTIGSGGSRKMFLSADLIRKISGFFDVNAWIRGPEAMERPLLHHPSEAR